MTPLREQGVPYPYHVQLEAGMIGIPAEKAYTAFDELQQLPGWSASFGNAKHHSLRYTYAPGRQAGILRSARKILDEAGAADPMLVAFVIWRMSFRLRGSIAKPRYAEMSLAVQALPNVLSTNLGPSDDRTAIVVEIVNEPSAALVEQIKAFVAPYAA